MQRKTVLTGMMAVVLLTLLAAFTQCRAGLWDRLVRKDREIFKKDRGLPERNCSFGYNSTTWRPWGTCCQPAAPGYSTGPWSGGTTMPPADSYSTPTYGAPTYGAPTYSTPTYGAPDGIEYDPPGANDSEPLESPQFPPIEQGAPGGDLVLPPADPGPLQDSFEEPIPVPSSLPGVVAPQSDGIPTLNNGGPLEGTAPTDLTSPSSLLPPAPSPTVPLPKPATPPPETSVPLPTPSSIPGGPAPDGQTLRVPGNWQPISYAQPRQPAPRQSRTQPRSGSASSQWRVMPGYYGPQRSTTTVDRFTNTKRR